MAPTAFHLLLNGINVGTVRNAADFQKTKDWIEMYLSAHPEIDRATAKVSFEFIKEEPCKNC